MPFFIKWKFKLAKVSRLLIHFYFCRQIARNFLKFKLNIKICFYLFSKSHFSFLNHLIMMLLQRYMRQHLVLSHNLVLLVVICKEAMPVLLLNLFITKRGWIQQFGQSNLTQTCFTQLDIKVLRTNISFKFLSDGSRGQKMLRMLRSPNLEIYVCIDFI